MTAPRSFSLDYVEPAVLGDGTRVRLRLVVPEDKDGLRAGFERWSPASRYSRFLASKATLSDAELAYLCDIDYENHFAIGAERDDDEASDQPRVGLGIARFIRLADRPEVAEAAVAVADEAQRKGLGELLLRRLIAAAHERGIERFRFEVLGTNAGMVALLAKLAPERSVGVDGGRAARGAHRGATAAADLPAAARRGAERHRVDGRRSQAMAAVTRIGAASGACATKRHDRRSRTFPLESPGRGR
jgi:ribosomal protein S18 acetylase RimI-like enzyme